VFELVIDVFIELLVIEVLIELFIDVFIEFERDLLLPEFTEGGLKAFGIFEYSPESSEDLFFDASFLILFSCFFFLAKIEAKLSILEVFAGLKFPKAGVICCPPKADLTVPNAEGLKGEGFCDLSAELESDDFRSAIILLSTIAIGLELKLELLVGVLFPLPPILLSWTSRLMPVTSFLYILK